MKERNIQDYLFANPEVLFPSGNITEKAREYSIQGKRIDLLFVVDGVRYIVEIKNVPIQREHIGQVVEYYGLMKQYMKDANLAMILVSSSIPAWRAVFLGRCQGTFLKYINSQKFVGENRGSRPQGGQMLVAIFLLWGTRGRSQVVKSGMPRMMTCWRWPG
jgi:RecB family endonuclease NucS